MTDDQVREDIARLARELSEGTHEERERARAAVRDIAERARGPRVADVRRGSLCPA